MAQELVSAVGGGFAVLVGMAYGLGFLLVNTHLARLAVAPIGLLQARYLQAGVLGIAVLTVPLATGVAFHTEWQSLPEGGMMPFVFSLIVTAAVSLLAWDVLLFPLRVGPRFIATRDETWFLLATSCASGMLMASISKGWPSSFELVTVVHILRAVVLLMGSLGAVLYFSFRIYPRLRTDLGGGAAWVVNITLKGQSIPGALAAAVSRPVLLLSRTNTSLFIRGDGTDAFSTVEISGSDVAAIEILGMTELHPAPLRPVAHSQEVAKDVNHRLMRP